MLYITRLKTNLGRVRPVVAASILALMGGLLVSCTPAQSPASTDAAAVAVQVAPAVVGDVSASAVYVANIEARDRVDLLPLGAGRIEKLNVNIGSPVQEGQVIAELGKGVLNAQLQQARASLLNAEARLASLQAQVGPNQIKAQSQVDAARARLQKLVSPSPLDLQAATSAVDQARAELESARTQLDQLRNPSESSLVAARAAVAEAENRLSVAQVAVNQAISQQLSSPDNPMRSNARQWWRMLLGARLNLQASVAALQNLQTAYGLGLTDSEVDVARQVIAQNQASITSLLGLIEASSVIPQEINQALWAEASAAEALEDARAKLGELEDPSRNAVALAQHRIDAARASLDAAVAELDLLRDPTLADLAAAKAEVAQAEQALALSQDDHVRYDIAAAQATVDQAQAQVELVEQQLSDTLVLAPFDGFVVKKWLSPGAVVSPQSPIVTVSSAEIVVAVQVEDTRINSLQEGQLVTFTTPVLPGRRLELRVDRVSPSGDRRTLTFPVQLQPVEIAPDLRPGMSGEVSIETRREEVVLVPKEAVFYEDNQATVFVVHNGSAYRREVVTGLEDTDRVEVRNGVQAGDQVVVSGREYLRDGGPVAIETAS